MGLNFHKSVKVADGVKLNVGKKSAGVSVGGKYAGVSYNTKSGARVRASLPGTGLSYTKSLNGGKKKSASKTDSGKTSVKKGFNTILTVIIVVVALCFIVGKNWDKISDTLGLNKAQTENATGAVAGAAGGDIASGDVTYIINTSTKKIHMEGCTYADTSKSNVTATDKSLEALLDEGYAKCSKCFK